MPELPEVQTVVDTLRPRILNRKITNVQLNRSDVLLPAGTDLASQLIGRKVVDVSRRGKKIVFELNDGNQFYIHLGMSGRLGIYQPTVELTSHTHLVIWIGTDQLRFRDPRRFGGIWWLGKEQSAEGTLGPEPLKMRPQQLAKRLAKTTRAIKSALLDQTLVAGLGNIYVDESLFHARIHPQTRACDLSVAQIARLNRSIKTILRRALRHRGSTLRDYVDANGNPGAFKNLHAVYDRAGEKCRRCKTPISRIVLGGRSTHFCANCQKR